MSTRSEETRSGPGWRMAFSPRVISGLVAIADAMIVITTGMAVYMVYIGWNPESFPAYLAATSFNLALTIGGFYFAGLYGFDAITAPRRQAHKVLSICAIVFLLLVLMAFALKISAEFSRVWSFASFLTEALLIFSARLYFHRLMVKWARAGRLVRRIAIVGAGDQGARLARELEREKEKSPWLSVTGVYDDRKERSPSTIGAYPYRGDLDGLIRDSREARIDDIIVALPWSAEDRLQEILRTLGVLPAQILLSPDLIGHSFPLRDYSRIGDISCLSVGDKPISDWNYLLKGIEDRLLASILLLLLLPLLGAIAAAIKLDSPGPVLFRQKRYGFNNELFEVLKFRTMHHLRPPEKDVPQATREDPRVTRIGGFLRRGSLDELPQLFNVLQGAMSLVGPRPHAVEHNEQYAALIAGYFARHRVKPGITGWAQVNGLRGETDTPDKMAARVKYDVHYIENWSLLFDLKILAMTPYALLANKNVY